MNPYTAALTGAVTREPWHTQAACVEADPTDFDLDSPGANIAEVNAKAVCAECPVSTLCLEEAMRMEHEAPTSLRFGVFGGLNPKERSKLAKGAA
jgi:WhiB family redox-sensing transcriptional regulator